MKKGMFLTVVFLFAISISIGAQCIGELKAEASSTYVQVGDTVSAGSVLCIIEAMKLMNEIESDVEGKIVKILVENGKPVEYNQPLFMIQAA